MFEQIEGPIGACFDDWIPDVGQVGNAFPILEAVAPTALRPALDDVAGDRTGGNAVPRVRCPSERVHQRSEREARVRHTTGDDDLRAALQRRYDRSGAEIGVGGQHAIAYVVQRASGVQVLEVVPARE